MQQPANRQHKSRLGSLLWLLALFALLAVLVLNQRTILDWWKLRDYQAPADVSQLATETTMNDSARRVFYVNDPQIQEKPAFADSCISESRQQEQTIVLGCYHSNQRGIFLLRVTDPRLNGVEQVTAAHELLHAEYDRLSRSDKANVDSMLQDYYEHDLTDQRIKDVIAAYRKTEPNDVVNEMHSIFATEIDKLPSGLENYYKRYFNNRAAIAALADQYQSEFTSRKAFVVQADAKLAALKTQIDNIESNLNSQRVELQQQKSNLDSLRSSGDFGAYNAAVSRYNSLVNQFNYQVTTLKSLIDQYNALVNQRNAVALEANQLTKELSNDTATINQ